MSGTVFFPEKSCSLSLGFFKQSVEKCTVGVTNRFVDITKQKVFVQVNFPRL